MPNHHVVYYSTKMTASRKVVLVCVGEHRREVQFEADEVGGSEKRKLQEAVLDAFRDVFADCNSADSLLLQIKSEGWGGEFVDLGESAVPNSAVVRAVFLDPQSLVKSLPATGVSVSKKLGGRSDAERKQLAKLFPSSKGRTSTYNSVFDPTVECVADTAHKKKKKSSTVAGRATSREVLLMKAFRNFVPIKKYRCDLKHDDRIKTLQFRRNMSPLQVKNVIRRGFRHIKFTSFLFLETTSNSLSIARDQDMNGAAVIDRRGSLYLCEDNSQRPGSSGMHHTAASSRSEQVESDSDENLPIVSLTNKQAGNRNVLLQHMQPQSVAEWRAVREQQDEEYRESLKKDQEKVIEIQAAVTRQEMVELLRGKLVAKEGALAKRIKSITFRLPSGERLEEKFDPEESTKALYQYVFCCGMVHNNFGIFVAYPRELLPTKGLCKIGDIEGVLAIEEDECFSDPLHYLNEEVEEELEAADIVLKQDEEERHAFMVSQSTSTRSLPHTVVREKIFGSVMTLYRTEMDTIVNEYPFSIAFEGERAVDLGGVSRDMFTAFFDESYKKLFDGCTLLSPAVHPSIDFSSLPLFGAVLSHAYLVSGVLPVRVSFPSLVQCFLGPLVTITDSIMFTSFINSLSTHDAGVLRVAFCEVDAGTNAFTTQTQSGLVELASRFGSRNIPTPPTAKVVFLQIARYEFVLKPAAAIAAISSGIPSQHASFWQKLGVQGLFRLYQAKSVSSAKVLKMFDDVQASDSNQERILVYLKQYIGSLNTDDLESFLRFVTGSSVCMANKIQVSFNSLSGAARRPIAHTCEPSLELSSTYETYLEFVRELRAVVNVTDKITWEMNAL